MRRKQKKGMDIHYQKDIREAVYERFQAVCGTDADRCSEIMGGLEKSMEPVDEEYYILCFDAYGNPFLILEGENAPQLN